LSPFPSLLVAFFHCFGVKSYSLSPVSAPHVLLKDAAGRVKEEERKGKRGRENPCDTGTRWARPTERSYGGRDKGGAGVCRKIEQEFAVLSIPDTPKLVHITFFESPTFVN